MKKKSFYKISNFVIYHCPDLQKVGCTNNFDTRKSQYPSDTRMEIIETLENVSEFEAGDREWFWADNFDYNRGMHYTQCGPSAHDSRNKTLGKSGLVAARKAQIETLGPEGLSKASQKRADNIGKSGYKEIRRKQIETLGPGGLSQIAKTRWVQFSKEQRSAIISKGWETRRANKAKGTA